MKKICWEIFWGILIAKKFSNTRHPLINPIDELINNYESFENDFKCFYPSVIEYANELKIIL